MDNVIDYIEGDWIYDIETYPNCFTLCAVYSNGGGIRVFELSDRRDDIIEMFNFLLKVRNNKHRMVGFNNVNFDYPVLHYMIEQNRELYRHNRINKITAKEVYDHAMSIITSADPFFHRIKDKEVTIPQVDLFKVHHFDNKARLTSLKELEFNMRSETIEDLPFPPGTILSEEDIKVLIEYNKHDVMQTLAFYYHSLNALRFREKLSLKYGFDCINYNDTKIGKEYFINTLESHMPGSCYTYTKRGRKLQQTKRDSIDISSIIFPYVSFNRPEFQAVLKWLTSQVITETKGVFSEIKECDLGDVAKYAEMNKKGYKIKEDINDCLISALQKNNSKLWIEERELKSGKTVYWACHNEVDKLNVVVDGFRFDFGTGGIHGSLNNSTVHSNEEWQIIDCDVASMYPSLSIANKVYPAHLSEKFCDIYEDVYKERKKHPKGTPENAVMKLALNGTYGDSNSKFSPLYDPAYTMAITINGQLSLCMLAERLLDINCQLIQVNTDGITCRVHKDSVKDYYDICEEWERVTGLSLEYADYESMFIRDVNNYIAVYKEN